MCSSDLSQIDPGPAPVDPATLPGYENMGKPGYHTIHPGETVRRIAADYGQNWRDVISWNPQLANAPPIHSARCSVFNSCEPYHDALTGTNGTNTPRNSLCRLRALLASKATRP